MIIVAGTLRRPGPVMLVLQSLAVVVDVDNKSAEINQSIAPNVSSSVPIVTVARSLILVPLSFFDDRSDQRLNFLVNPNR